MSKERPPSPDQPPLPDGFDFSDNERLFDRVTHERFARWFADARTTVHSIRLDSNRFGEFLFVTVSRPGDAKREVVTFYGLGYHDYRERWVTQEWFWYQSQWRDHEADPLARDEADQTLAARIEEVRPYTHESTQSQRGALFEMLADLTDDDGAYSDFEDFASWLDDEV